MKTATFKPNFLETIFLWTTSEVLWIIQKKKDATRSNHFLGKNIGFIAFIGSNRYIIRTPSKNENSNIQSEFFRDNIFAYVKIVWIIKTTRQAFLLETFNIGFIAFIGSNRYIIRTPCKKWNDQFTSIFLMKIFCKRSRSTILQFKFWWSRAIADFTQNGYQGRRKWICRETDPNECLGRWHSRASVSRQGGVPGCASSGRRVSFLRPNVSKCDQNAQCCDQTFQNATKTHSVATKKSRQATKKQSFATKSPDRRPKRTVLRPKVPTGDQEAKFCDQKAQSCDQKFLRKVTQASFATKTCRKVTQTSFATKSFQLCDELLFCFTTKTFALHFASKSFIDIFDDKTFLLHNVGH